MNGLLQMLSLVSIAANQMQLGTNQFIHIKHNILLKYANHQKRSIRLGPSQSRSESTCVPGCFNHFIIAAFFLCRFDLRPQADRLLTSCRRTLRHRDTRNTIYSLRHQDCQQADGAAPDDVQGISRLKLTLLANVQCHSQGFSQGQRREIICFRDMEQCRFRQGKPLGKTSRCDFTDIA